jgi:hypothetical protein
MRDKTPEKALREKKHGKGMFGKKTWTRRTPTRGNGRRF